MTKAVYMREKINCESFPTNTLSNAYTFNIQMKQTANLFPYI